MIIVALSLVLTFWIAILLKVSGWVYTLLYFVAGAGMFYYGRNHKEGVAAFLGVMISGLVLYVMYLLSIDIQFTNLTTVSLIILLSGGLISLLARDDGMYLLMTGLAVFVIITSPIIANASLNVEKKVDSKISDITNKKEIDQRTNLVDPDKNEKKETYLTRTLTTLKKLFTGEDLLSPTTSQNKKDYFLEIIKLSDVETYPEEPEPNSEVSVKIKSKSRETDYERENIVYIVGISLGETAQALGAKCKDYENEDNEYNVHCSSLQSNIITGSNTIRNLFLLSTPSCKDYDISFNPYNLYFGSVSTVSENLIIMNKEKYIEYLRSPDFKSMEVSSTDTDDVIDLKITTNLESPIPTDRKFILSLDVLNTGKGYAYTTRDHILLAIPDELEVAGNCDFEELTESEITKSKWATDKKDLSYRIYKPKLEPKIKNSEQCMPPQKNNKLTFSCVLKYNGKLEEYKTMYVFSKINYAYLHYGDTTSIHIKDFSYETEKKCSEYIEEKNTKDLKNNPLKALRTSEERNPYDEIYDVLFGSGFCDKDYSKVNTDSNYLFSAYCNVTSSFNSIADKIDEIAKICYSYEVGSFSEEFKCARIEFDLFDSTGNCGSDTLSLNQVGETKLSDWIDLLSNKENFIISTLTGKKNKMIIYDAPEKLDAHYNYVADITFRTECLKSWVDVNVEEVSGGDYECSNSS